MLKRTCLIAGSLSVLFAGMTRASFVVNSVGPDDVVGAVGTPGNGLVLPSYAGPTYVADYITVAGTLTRVNPSSLASDSSWRVKAKDGFGYGFSFSPLMTSVGAYTSLNLSATVHGLFWIKNYPVWQLEASIYGTDNAGVDAQWTNTTFTFHDVVPGPSPYHGGGVFSADSGGSSIPVKMALYTSEGGLVGEGTQTLSSGTAGLAAGTYYLVTGGAGSTFAEDYATPGTEAGTLVVNVNGQNLFTGSLESDRLNIIALDIVPEPTCVLGGLFGAVVFLRRAR